MNILVYYKKTLLIGFAVFLGIGIKVFGQDTIMYRGGYADGANNQLLENFYPVRLNHFVIYGGGIGDGGVQAIIDNFYPSALTHYLMYKGGTGDGTAGLEEHVFNPSFLDHQNMYVGNSGDGASLGMYEEYARPYLDHYSIYTGGQGDGYAGYLAVSYTPLVVNLLSFTGDLIAENFGLLQWKIVQGRNVQNYELQKSSNGRLFTTIYTKSILRPSDDEQAYQYEEHKLFEGENYYRLIINEIDGYAKFSGIVLLFYKNGRESLTVFPNPVTTNLNINYQSRQSAQVRMMDIKGAVLFKQSIKAGTQIAIVPVQQLTAGTYVLQVIYENGKTESIKFVKKE